MLLCTNQVEASVTAQEKLIAEVQDLYQPFIQELSSFFTKYVVFNI